MVTIGSNTLPGTITEVESATSAAQAVAAPGTPALLGQAYLSEGSASANTAYRVTRLKQARDLFGPTSNSMLTQAVQDALIEGASQVYAIPASTTSQTDDLSGTTSATGTLANTPVVEVADDITFTVNSTTKTTTLYYDGDPSNATPGTDEVLLNPQSGEYHIDEQSGNTGDDVTYSSVSYTDALTELTDALINGVHIREVVDFVLPVDENDDVVSDVHDKVNAMETNGYFAIAQAGAGSPYIDDAETGTDELQSWTNPFDSDRAQLLHPSRKGDGSTVLGAYAGVRARLGINASSMFKQIQTVNDLRISLTTADKEALVNNQAVPLDERRSSARIVEDLTTVSDDNTEEQAWERSFSRLVTDFVVESVNQIAEDGGYIGDFNNSGTLNSFRGSVSSFLGQLRESNSIEDYALTVEEIDSVTAACDVGIDTADPLRNIELTVSAGDVQGGGGE